MAAIIACHPDSYGRFGALGAIENIRSAGIEHIELPIRTAGVESRLHDRPLVTTETSPRDLETVDRLLDRHGVRVASCNICSGNPLDRQVLHLTLRKLELAARFGVKLVVGDAGEANGDESLATLHRNLLEIGDRAATLGITYCFETHPGICQNHYAMLHTMQVLSHPNLKLNFDTANILYYNENLNGEIALARVCHEVRHVHLKDSQGEYGRWHFPAIGYGGAVDFVRVLQLLRPCGFVGPYSLEIEGVAGEGELSLGEYHERIVKSVHHLRDCGYFD